MKRSVGCAELGELGVLETPPNPLTPHTLRRDANSLVHVFAELLGEGVELRLVGGHLFTQGARTERAQALLDAHGAALAPLAAALAAGRITRATLVKALGTEFAWPGTLEAVPHYPGRLAFALGVELRRCADCARLAERGICERYEVPTGRLNRQRVRCIAFVPPSPRSPCCAPPRTFSRAPGGHRVGAAHQRQR